MVEGAPKVETITLEELIALPTVDREGRQWAGATPEHLRVALEDAACVDAIAAENNLSPLLEGDDDAPEPWWGLAVALVRQSDLHSAAICYENFRDRVAHLLDEALRVSSEDFASAARCYARLAPCAERCRDHRLAARCAIAEAGVWLTLDSTDLARKALTIAYGRLRRVSPRSWGLNAEWLASTAIAAVDQGMGARSLRTLALALRLSLVDRDNPGRSALIARDLGLLLYRLDIIDRADTMFGRAVDLAGGAGQAELIAGIGAARAKNLIAQRRYLEAGDLIEDALDIALPARERADALLTAADLLSRIGYAHRDRAQLEEAYDRANEAAGLLGNLGADGVPAWREMATLAALLGNRQDAERWLARLLRARPRSLMGAAERLAIAYIPYVLRALDGQPRKVLFWAEARLRLGARAGSAPREMLVLREHCLAAAERCGDADRVRTYAGAMLASEAAMLRLAFGAQRGPADWNRQRIAREALSILAWRESIASDEGASWRMADALLSGRGLARAARRAARDGGLSALQTPSLADLARQLRPGDAVLGLAALHPPAPLDPAIPWANGMGSAQLTRIWLACGDPKPTITPLGSFAAAEIDGERWRLGCAAGLDVEVPAFLRLPAGAFDTVKRIIFLAEGSLELLPLRLVESHPEIVQVPQLMPFPDGGGSARDHGATLTLVGHDMLAAPDWPEATERELGALKAAGPVVDGVGRVMSHDDAWGQREAVRRIHVIAHGHADRDTSRAELDVYGSAHIALDDDQVLHASTIADRHLDHIELVVLSSCDTGLGVPQYSEGLASMAAAFLDAGARCVIATLWPVPHDETARFMEILYGQSLSAPAIALRDAQRLARGEGLSQWCWAAWTVFMGGRGYDEPRAPEAHRQMTA